jgi:hypothetical protein
MITIYRVVLCRPIKYMLPSTTLPLVLYPYRHWAVVNPSLALYFDAIAQCGGALEIAPLD